MKTDQVLVKNSGIEGKGVFAHRDFKKGEIVLHWDTSHTLPKEKVEKMSNEEKKYISFLDGKYVILQEPEKYVNHSCEPNTTAQHFCDVAMRDIQQGEEITADYSEELPPNTYMECNCGRKKCRKIIRS
ncbi:SET domain-containing protein [Candidatus Peregrinibacteria bacterium]|nr:SET domain-containing protein [Candidatus Peregrinibacteria bacterium]